MPSPSSSSSPPSSPSSWWLGVLLALLGSSLESLGLALQKRAQSNVQQISRSGFGSLSSEEMRVLEDLDEDEDEDGGGGNSSGQIQHKNTRRRRHKKGLLPAYMYERAWIVGFAVFLVGNIGDFAALGLTQQSTVSLIGGWALCVNAMVAPLLLNESFHVSSDLPAIVAILLGLFLTIAVCEPGADTTHAGGPCAETSRLVARWRKPAASLYITFVMLGGFSLLALVRRGVVRAYPFLGAVVGAVTILTAKVASESIDCVLSGENHLTPSEGATVALLTCIFAVSLPMQIHAINVSLGHNDALYHIPSFFVLWNLLSIMSSAVVYEEIKLGSRDGESFYFFGMSLTSPDPLASAWALFVLGVGSLFLGVYLAASRSRTSNGFDSVELDDDDDNVDSVQL